MARVEAPKSQDYETRATMSRRNSRIIALSKKPQMTQPDKDEALRLLLEDFVSRNANS